MGNNLSVDKSSTSRSPAGSSGSKGINDIQNQGQKLAQNEIKGMTRSASGSEIGEQRYGSQFVPIEKLAKVNKIIFLFCFCVVFV